MASDMQVGSSSDHMESVPGEVLSSSSFFLKSFCNSPFVAEFARKFANNPALQKTSDFLQSGKFNEEELYPSNVMDADALELEVAAKEYMEGLLERHPYMKEEFHKVYKHIRKDPAYKSFADNTDSATALIRYLNSDKGKALGFCADKSADDEAFERVKIEVLKEYIVHQAVSLGDVEGLKKALKTVPDINKKDGKGMTALVVACALGQSSCARILIEAGAEVNVFDENCNTPLHYAALKGMKNCAWHLLKHGADIAWQNNKGLTPYQLAKDAGQSKELLMLIKSRRTWAVVEVDGQSREVLQLTKRPRTSSIAAEVAGQSTEPLHLNKRTLYFNSDKGKALGFCADKSVDDEAFERMKIEVPKEYIVHQAVSLGDVEGLKEALKTVSDINKKDGRGMTALVFACALGKWRCARVLIEAGAEVNAFDENCNTPLHYAALNGRKKCVWHLLKHGADITWQNNEGLTPYQLAKDADQSKEVLKLIKRPRTWSVVEVDGQSRQVLKLIKRPRTSAA